jgi:hypothetical protein
VREIRSHTGGVDNIIEGKVINKRGRLQQKGERLDGGLVEARKRPDELGGIPGQCHQQLREQLITNQQMMDKTTE